jgi:hypothetical protein
VNELYSSNKHLNEQLFQLININAKEFKMLHENMDKLNLQMGLLVEQQRVITANIIKLQNSNLDQEKLTNTQLLISSLHNLKD